METVRSSVSTQASKSELPAIDWSAPGAIVPVQQRRSVSVIPPPLWLKRLVLWFRVGLALFVLLSVLLGATGCTLSSAASVSWRSASDVFSSAQLAAIIAQNFTGLDAATAAKSMRAWTINGASGRVVILDFNNPGLCGSAGCLYTGYLVNDRTSLTEVLRARLHPELPKSKQIFTVGEAGETGLPCLEVWQRERLTQLKQIQFCYNGQSYQPTRQTLFQSS